MQSFSEFQGPQKSANVHQCSFASALLFNCVYMYDAVLCNNNKKWWNMILATENLSFYTKQVLLSFETNTLLTSYCWLFSYFHHTLVKQTDVLTYRAFDPSQRTKSLHSNCLKTAWLRRTDYATLATCPILGTTWLTYTQENNLHNTLIDLFNNIIIRIMSLLTVENTYNRIACQTLHHGRTKHV